MTESREHYLLAVYMLSKYEGKAQITDIASRLGVTKAATCNSIQVLQEEGYLDRTSDRRVVLTERGISIVEELLEKYDMLVELFNRILGVDSATAKNDAGNVAHLISSETFRQLDRYVQEEDVK